MIVLYNLRSFLRESAQGGPCVLTRLTNRVSFVEELGRKALQREERRVEEAILGKLQKIGQKTISNFSPFHLLQHESVCGAFEKVDIDCKHLQGFTGIYRGT